MRLLSLLLLVSGCSAQIAATNLENNRQEVRELLDVASITTDAATLNKMVQVLGHNYYTLDNILNDEPFPRPPLGGWKIPQAFPPATDWLPEDR